MITLKLKNLLGACRNLGKCRIPFRFQNFKSKLRELITEENICPKKCPKGAPLAKCDRTTIWQTPQLRQDAKPLAKSWILWSSWPSSLPRLLFSLHSHWEFGFSARSRNLRRKSNEKPTFLWSFFINILWIIVMLFNSKLCFLSFLTPKHFISIDFDSACLYLC